nr:MAG TPA: hypothetical protein [Caudoviricetes sp.]
MVGKCGFDSHAGNNNQCQQKGTPMPTTVLFDSATPHERIVGCQGVSL